ncbi:MAG: CinA family nicotinamide mononucleotide deamidase-related protein [Bacteroidetes bacterium]|uniref:CinA-like protein n=1 Tax=Candidatus Egerieousia excrementavium TaxID=2840778 RepID=A0A9D9DJC2_9BACT|nr:CinA family nicotinamide mononucleotide deamidase-related protein [Candidatus Egerieousia excrementavium]
MVTASICTIGDEILIGQIVDTNSSMISRALNAIGVKVARMISASDSKEDIFATIRHCARLSDIVILTGGLGPTKDDITKNALAEFTGAKGFVRSEEQYAIIEKVLAARGIELSDINRAQAMVPDTCKVILNECGTAPCMEFVLRREDGREYILFSMPGVPFETENALPKVIQEIISHFKMENIFHKTVCTFGIPESTLSKMIEKWEDDLPENIHLAYLPNTILGVRLRLSIYGTDKERGENEIDREIAKLRGIIGEAIYGYGESSLQEAIGKLLADKGMTVCTAESCTGGKIASLITNVAGASKYFKGSVIAYDNSIKENLLNVAHETLVRYGAVSRECVEQMAEGVRKAMNCDFSVATSGVAGPGGGSETNPVGTVWIAVSAKGKVKSLKLHFKAPRAVNIERFASHALNFLRETILEYYRNN